MTPNGVDDHEGDGGNEDLWIEMWSELAQRCPRLGEKTTGFLLVLWKQFIWAIGLVSLQRFEKGIGKGNILEDF